MVWCIERRYGICINIFNGNVKKKRTMVLFLKRAVILPTKIIRMNEISEEGLLQHEKRRGILF